LCVYFKYNYGQTLNCLIPYGGGLEYDLGLLANQASVYLRVREE
jgi:hypothetical protein